MASTEDTVVVAIGSKQAEWEPNNPWTASERRSMIERWAEKKSLAVEIVAIDDINDPPNWVEHATTIHGHGTLVTSDDATEKLYTQAAFPTLKVSLEQRDALEGWRVRQTAKMLSTVYDDEAVREVLKASIPTEVIEWLIENDALYRLSTFETGVYAG
tara:strand:- start:19255 stop:19728 length:474 start_codon:yes stop_codon:yes gene_type:complete